MKAIVFVGPTLERAELQRLAPDVTVSGPAACGDVLRAVQRGYTRLGLIDGFFDQQQPVWHKEILWALTQGCHVFGAASMGALRAAELHSFGMQGVGKIFELFRSGILERDDEVTIAHQTETEGYRNLSVSLINIRFTLRQALKAGVVSSSFAELFCQHAAALFYPERDYQTLLRYVRDTGQRASECAALATWLNSKPDPRVDQKRQDALELLAQMQAVTAPPAAANFELALTESWYELFKTTL